MVRSLFHRTCLKPSYSLRQQLMLSFGSASVLCLVLVVLVACICSMIAGETVKDHTDDLLRDQVVRRLQVNSRYVAETFSAYIDNLEGTVQLMTEITLDRIAGYPGPGWEEDEFVYFEDMETNTNKYPLDSPLLPMDWEINANIVKENSKEHLQERHQWEAGFFPPRSSYSASYFQQGACDPNETNATSVKFFPNCTTANNDWETGGVLQPTNTSRGLYKKAADLGVLLKPIFEAQPELSLAGVYFKNSGAGSFVQYPGNHFPAISQPYVSAGCEWMKQINPHTNRSFGYDEEIRRCRPAGTPVPYVRGYNPNERNWFQEIALSDKVSWGRPFNNTDNGEHILSIGRGVFDRITGEFIGCVGLHVAISTIRNILRKSRIHSSSDLAIVRYSDKSIFVHMDDHMDGDVDVVKTEFISENDLERLFNGVNYKARWTPEELAQSIEDNVILCSTGLYTAYPSPLPPQEYDPDYEPEYLVLHVVRSEAFDVTSKTNEQIERQVLNMCLLSLVLAAIGLLVIFIILWFVSRALTQPLLWMKHVAWEIVNHTDERSIDSFTLSENDDRVSSVKCTPKTEISDLVSEFRIMIGGFSGTGAAKLADSSQFEIVNQLTWQSDYQQLYSYVSKAVSRNSLRVLPSLESSEAEVSSENPSRIADVIESDTSPNEQRQTFLCVPAPTKKNFGTNITPEASFDDRKFSSRSVRVYRSSLFWWILILIVAPLVLTSFVICIVVSIKIINTVTDSVHSAGEASLALEVDTLRSIAQLKSTEVQMSINEVVRDLHIVTRVASWLLFGGIQRSNAFTRVDDSTQECRGYDWERICPILFDPERAPCACEWQDVNTKVVPCTSFNESTDLRRLQNRFFLSQRRDYDADTGNRDRATSFGRPGVDDSSMTTLWWDDIDDVPGAQNENNATGHATTYDRIRVSSAMSVVDIPVYNYATSLRRLKHDLGTFIAFQSDGMFTGYAGCSHQSAAYASTFESDKQNQAANIAPDLCPLGKFGYDPRCRAWYDAGQTLYAREGKPAHFTAPYRFADDSQFAASATSPIVNPTSGEYVGQTLIDFVPSSMRRMFASLEGPVRFVITPDEELDTVIRPGEFTGWQPASILDLLFLHENETSVNRQEFKNGILKRMKDGEDGVEYFGRLNVNGKNETLKIAFEPVKARSLLPLDPSDFSRGINVSELLVYSVGIAYEDESIHEPWESIEHDVYSELIQLRTIYISIIAMICILFAAFTCMITVVVVKPILTLLRITVSINTGEIDDDMPPLHGGSKEVYQVYNSFAKLYKIIRISNVAFFSGNLRWAYSFITDALRLFRKVGDEKAIGIACNNLGNTLYAMCRDEVHYDGDCCDLLNGICVVKAAKLHYDESILIAQKQLEQATDDKEKAEFALQLSDRLFNRALFLLLVAGDKCAPDNARPIALADISTVRELDYGVKDFWLEQKLLLKHSPTFFFRLRQRVLGLLDFYGDDEVRARYSTDELIEDGDRLLFAAWDQPFAPLFDDVSRVGRLQQLEALAMRSDLCKGRKLQAARLAMRMFAEDEYLLECAFMMASVTLLKVTREDEDGCSGDWSKSTKKSVRSDLRKMLRTCKQTNLDVGKCLIVAIEINERWEGDSLLDRVNQLSLKLYDDCCLKDDYMGLVAYTTQGDLNVPLGIKEENEGRQRTSLDIATTSTSERVCAAFPYAMQMLIDSTVSNENDTFIFLITDGFSWDSVAYVSIKKQIERLNRERETVIHVFIFGMEIEEEVVKEECMSMSAVSKLSLYMDITMSNVDSAFDSVGNLIRGQVVKNSSAQGIIMEKF